MQENKARGGKFANVRALLDKADDLLSELEPPTTLREQVVSTLWEFRRKTRTIPSATDAGVEEAADAIMKHILDKLHQ